MILFFAEDLQGFYAGGAQREEEEAAAATMRTSRMTATSVGKSVGDTP